jgi:hypothetical protein
MEIHHVLLIGRGGDLVAGLCKNLHGANITYSLYHWPRTDQSEHPRLEFVNKPFDAIILDCGEITEISKLCPWGEENLIKTLNAKFSQNIIVLTQGYEIVNTWDATRKKLHQERRRRKFMMSQYSTSGVNIPEAKFVERDVLQIMGAIKRL